MEFVYTEDENGKRTVYSFASHAPKGADLKTFKLEDTSKEGLRAVFQELFDMIDWNPEAKDEEPQAPQSEAMDTLYDMTYQSMSAKQQVRIRTLLDEAWPLMPVSFRADLIINFLEEVIRPMRINYE